MIAIFSVSELFRALNNSGTGMETVVFEAVLTIFVGSIFSKFIIRLSQVGQKKFQYITIINSLYATSISETVISIINNFFVIVIKYYAERNTLSQIFSGIASSLIYTFILRQEKLITARTQIIYFGIVLVLNSLIIYLTSFLK